MPPMPTLTTLKLATLSAVASIAAVISIPAFSTVAVGDPRRSPKNAARWQQKMTSFQPSRARGIGSSARRRGKVSARHKA